MTETETFDIPKVKNCWLPRAQAGHDDVVVGEPGELHQLTHHQRQGDLRM